MAERMTTKEKEEKLCKIMREWQHIENQSVRQAAEIIDKTNNPVIRMAMEIIQRDSAFHFRVQQFIIDSIEKNAVVLTVEELSEVWGSIEEHVAAEKKVEQLAKDAEEALKGTRNVVQHFLVSYLQTDEAKHDKLLEDLNLISKGMFKSAG